MLRDIFQKGKIFTHEMEGGDTVSAETIKNIEQFLYGNYGFKVSLSPIGAQWNVESGNYQGRFAKRVQNFMWKEFLVKMTTGDVERVGQIAKDGVPTKGVFYFDFTDEINWSHGEFGDYGSCFIKSDEKMDLMRRWKHKIWAVRFFSGPKYRPKDKNYTIGSEGEYALYDNPKVGNGIARSWLVFLDEADTFEYSEVFDISGISLTHEGVVVCNSYERAQDLLQRKQTEILSSWSGLPFHPLVVNNFFRDHWYTNAQRKYQSKNGSIDYLLSPAEEAIALRVVTLYISPNTKTKKCSSCDKERYVVAMHGDYCEDCRRKFKQCIRCGTKAPPHGIDYLQVRSNGRDASGYYCKRCQSLETRCAYCSNTIKVIEAPWTNIYVCADHKYALCDNCGTANVEGFRLCDCKTEKLRRAAAAKRRYEARRSELKQLRFNTVSARPRRRNANE